MWPFGNQLITLEYNGESYKLKSGDIPGLRGSGVITVVNRGNVQRQSTSGRFYGKLNQRQMDGRCYINGVEVSGLIERLKARD